MKKESNTCSYCEQGYLKIDGIHYDEAGFLARCTKINNKGKS